MITDAEGTKNTGSDSTWTESGTRRTQSQPREGSEVYVVHFLIFLKRGKQKPLYYHRLKKDGVLYVTAECDVKYEYNQLSRLDCAKPGSDELSR